MCRKRLGIMGGTFNPIHNGHLLLAEQARVFCSLQQVLFIPSGNSYLKDQNTIVDAAHRYQMTELAIADHPDFAVSDIEIKRSGATYTVDTLKELADAYPNTDFYFILGADSLFSIEIWKDVQEIFHRCVLVCADRGEISSKELSDKITELEKRFHANIILLPERRFDVSSTELRGLLAEGGSVKYLMPDAVISYIKDNHLYDN